MNIEATELDTPVILLIYNRPSNVKELLNLLAKICPKKLYVISDGPRPNNNEDKKLVEECRAIFKDINWSCNTVNIYSEYNLGLKKRIISGLNEVFKHESKAIILEDDCIPNEDFFNFCEHLLKKYEHDKRVFSISGTNPFYAEINSSRDYFFSRYHSCWGWATWKNRWAYFDENLEFLIEKDESKYLQEYLTSKREARYWCSIINKIKKNQTNSWAYIWSLSCYFQSGLQVVPSRNLVKNIGFSEQSTHTKLKPNYAVVETQRLKSLKNEPKNIKFHPIFDELRRNRVFSKSFKYKIIRLLSILKHKIKL